MFEPWRSSPDSCSARSCIMFCMPMPRSTTMKQFDCWIIMRMIPVGDCRPYCDNDCDDVVLRLHDRHRAHRLVAFFLAGIALRAAGPAEPCTSEPPEPFFMDNGPSAAQISGTLNSTIRTALDVPAGCGKDFMNYFSGDMRIASATHRSRTRPIIGVMGCWLHPLALGAAI